MRRRRTLRERWLALIRRQLRRKDDLTLIVVHPNVVGRSMMFPTTVDFGCFRATCHCHDGRVRWKSDGRRRRKSETRHLLSTRVRGWLVRLNDHPSRLLRSGRR